MSCADEIKRRAAIANITKMTSLEDIGNGMMEAGVVLVQHLVDPMEWDFRIEAEELIENPGTIEVSNATQTL